MTFHTYSSWCCLLRLRCTSEKYSCVLSKNKRKPCSPRAYILMGMMSTQPDQSDSYRFVSVCWEKQVRPLTENTGGPICFLGYHKPGGWNNRNVLSHSSGSYMSRIKVSMGLVPSEGWEGRVCSLPPSYLLVVGQQSWAFFGLWKHHFISACIFTCSPWMCICIQISPSL